MLGWGNFAVSRFVEKVVPTVRIKAYAVLVAASVVHAVAGAVLHGCWLDGWKPRGKDEDKATGP